MSETARARIDILLCVSCAKLLVLAVASCINYFATICVDNSSSVVLFSFLYCLLTFKDRKVWSFP